MRRAILAIFTAAVLFRTAGGTWAGETQVTVEKGKVEAVTATGTVTVAAGHKAILKDAQAPEKMTEEPMVRDMLTMYDWLKGDPSRKDPRLNAATALVMSFESETLVKSATLAEYPNSESKPIQVEHWGPTGLPGPIKFYDLDGDLLEHELEKAGEENGMQLYNISIHLAKPVPPGGNVTLIMLLEMHLPVGDLKLLWKDGPVWKCRFGNESQFNLNYYEVILPESAILLDCDRPIVGITDREGRTVVIMRNQTDERGDLGSFLLTFLWPEKDGLTLLDVPERYRNNGVLRGAASEKAEKR